MRPLIVAELITPLGASMDQTSVWATPASEVRSVQGPDIPLRLGHGEPPCGRIVHLERWTGAGGDGSVWCVGELDHDIRLPPDGRFYLSAEVVFDEGGLDVEVRGAALTRAPCSVAIRPALIIRDGLTPQGKAVFRLDPFRRGLLEHAEARKRKWARDPILVRDNTPADIMTSFFRSSTGRTEYGPSFQGSILNVG